MKRIGKLLIFLLIALLVLILAGYFLIQTRWGAAQVGHWVTDNSNYQLTVEAVDRSPFFFAFPCAVKKRYFWP